MFKGFYNLTSGMLTQGRRLDVISNNMTNVATAGYKTDTFTATTFDEVMWQRVGNKRKVYEELGEQSFITAPSELYTDHLQGSFDETGLPLDFGIEGAGYFAVNTPQGRMYTRNGSFSLDNDGYLYLPGQGRVLDPNGQEIQLGTDKLSGDGYGNLYDATGNYYGSIGVFAFADPGEQLEKNDQGMFVSDAQPQAVVSIVHQKMLERSNVDWVREITQMISGQRAYQSAAEVTKIYDQVMRQATEDVGRLV